ncbi:hypothetical protein FPE01S_02_09090 [Flavihumibacter petaseus NBRC 106054]|uniref:Uncharacterized protein n=1 Tax=Flavihumibacter petaseus NBRC 106054 TaxID=1220578 RepID=A0A0E9N1Z3_9BACT|nr:hypothetical protein FPE01S_02_09090 [Flavihumibacter petaseus NBRC 106054]
MPVDDNPYTPIPFELDVPFTPIPVEDTPLTPAPVPDEDPRNAVRVPVDATSITGTNPVTLDETVSVYDDASTVRLPFNTPLPVYIVGVVKLDTLSNTHFLIWSKRLESVSVM